MPLPNPFDQPVPPATRARWLRFSRRIGEHIPAFAADGTDDLQAVSLVFAVVAIGHIFFQSWEVVAGLAGLIVLNSLAVHLARRPHIRHWPARLLCGVYFRTLRSTATRQPVRRTLRIGVLLGLMALLIASLFIGSSYHRRPPLVDPRLLSRTRYMDYLREHDFFRDAPAPPAPAQRP